MLPGGIMLKSYRALLAALFASLTLVVPAHAQEKTGLKPGFVLRPGSARIVLMRPSISVVAYAEPISGNPAKVAEYQELFGAVASSVIEYQFFRGNRLPTKKRKDQFEWGLGPDVRTLPGLDKADYALFITTEDHFGSTGRKVLQLFAAMANVGVTAGVHKGFAGLVDLRTGELVWLNADMQMGGDVRDAAGADKRVRQLLEGFPGKPLEAAAVAAATAPLPALASAR